MLKASFSTSEAWGSAQEFVQAYERQIAEYKRLGGDAHLKATVILNQEDVADAAQNHVGDTPTELPALELDDELAGLADDDVANEELPAGDFHDDAIDRANP